MDKSVNFSLSGSMENRRVACENFLNELLENRIIRTNRQFQEFVMPYDPDRVKVQTLPPIELEEELTVLVTGASGYIASHIIKLLQERGYRVIGTVRSLDNPERYEHLTKLCKNPRYQLELRTGDLLVEGSFDEAVQGCQYVIHTASPFIRNVENPQEDLIDPAVNGTLNVLNSCTREQGIQRVIITSSQAAITLGVNSEKRLVNEKDWNEEANLELEPYYYSKRCAEEATWNFMNEEERHFSVACINPSFVLGPLLHDKHSGESVDFLAELLNGRHPGVAKFGFPHVDVRDVARAHILAMENEELRGRFLISGESEWLTNTARILKKYFPDHPVPTTQIPGAILHMNTFIDDKISSGFINRQLNNIPLIDNTKSRVEMGLSYTLFEDTLVDMAKSLIEYGHVHRK
eukprot:TRINITY_DN1515_c0_g1_i2.p1 TRINITY_DN1515_c0_g1~~TRINITY_DN1515_c0_g1_i2.p1  ORF type:complete len:406 (+),score=85.19 TRINITY_DN1515_c0_g1_i2:565-1782(+)